MKKFKVVLAILSFLSTMAFAEFNDVPDSHWASEAVKTLYNKGLLAPTLDSAVRFNGDGVFSRYEIASMLYFTVQDTDQKLAKKASIEDVSKLRSLLQEFTPEIAKIGGRADAVDKKLKELEDAVKKGGNTADLEKKINKRFDLINDKLNRVTVSGNFNIDQTIGLKSNKPGMDTLNYLGTVTIGGQTTLGPATVSSKVKFNTEFYDKAPNIDALELKAKSDGINLNVFKDNNKDGDSLLAFGNTFALFSGKVVSPDNGIVVNGALNNDFASPTYLGLLFKTSAGDFYGAQVKTDLNILKKAGFDSFVRGTYSEKVVKYQYDSDKDSDNAKSFYAVDGALGYKFGDFAAINVAGEYGTRRSPGITDIVSDECTAVVPSRDAIYLYSTAKLNIPFIGRYGAAAGFYNSGEYFDIAGVGDNQKTVFSDSETKIIKLESDKKGIMVKANADLFGLGMFLAEARYATYGSNVKANLPKEDIGALVTLNLIPSKLKIEGSYTIDRKERKITDWELGTDQQAFDEYKAGKPIAYKGKTIIEPKVKINILEGVETNITATLEDNQDIDNAKDTENKIVTYADTTITPSTNLLIKIAGKYTKEGLELKDGIENVTYDMKSNDEIKKGRTVEIKDYKKNGITKIDSGFAIQIKDIKSGTYDFGKVNFGGRYSSEDKVGAKIDSDDFGKNTELKDDKSITSAFVAHEMPFGKFKVTYGARYKIEMKAIENTKGYEQIDNLNKNPENPDNSNLGIAVGFEYDFGNETVAKLKIGDPTVVVSDTDFILDKTAFAEGEANQVKFEVAAKF